MIVIGSLNIVFTSFRVFGGEIRCRTFATTIGAGTDPELVKEEWPTRGR